MEICAGKLKSSSCGYCCLVKQHNYDGSENVRHIDRSDMKVYPVDWSNLDQINGEDFSSITPSVSQCVSSF